MTQTRTFSRSTLAVLLGGFALAATAGCINVVVIAEGGLAVTHVTGSITGISADLAGGVLDHAATVGAIVLAFAMGAACSGAMIGDRTLQLGRPYGLAIMLEGLLLIGAGRALPDMPVAGMALAAAAAGLQNAYASAYRGMVVRTTHATGLITDIGFLAGAALRHRRIAGWRFAMLAGLLVSFVGGGIIGALVRPALGSDTLTLLGSGLVLAGGGYFVWRRWFLSPPRSAVA